MHHGSVLQGVWHCNDERIGVFGCLRAWQIAPIQRVTGFERRCPLS